MITKKEYDRACSHSKALAINGEFLLLRLRFEQNKNAHLDSFLKENELFLDFDEFR
jgi:hypothetical protein